MEPSIKGEKRGNREMEWYQESILKRHYDGILETNRERILRGGVGDPHLLHPESDTRMALALVIRPIPDLARRMAGYLESLEQLAPELYHYPASDFHVTVLDLLRGEAGRTLPKNWRDYARCIRDCAREVSPFGVKWSGLCSSDSAVLVRGYYEVGLEQLRQTIRGALAAQGLPLEERYRTISAHITVARIPTRLHHPSEVLDFVGQDVPFGEMNVEAVELVFHNWYDSQKHVLDTIPLG